jgi:hypothetical protein
MIPYNPLSLNGMIRPPDAPNPDALIEAGQPQSSQQDGGGLQSAQLGAGEASPQQRTMPVSSTDQSDYLALGLAGNLSQDQIDALQEALAQSLAANEQRAEQMQRIRSKEPQVPQSTPLSGNAMPMASQPGMNPGVGTPSSGPSFTHGHN